jgi:lysyl-tRNA synthetase class 2
VRKLRQSVNRVARRGWRIEAYRGREIDARLEAEIDALEADWRSRHDRMLGFAMAMGEFDLGVRPADLYVLAWSPEGRLGAVMRFLSYRGNLSLDTMRRVGETPNGLNESLVCRALLFAREHGVREVSLNYAGLGHLVRSGPSGSRPVRAVQRMALSVLGRHFQMDRLVLFNSKFSPQWRPRYLVYESRRNLPGAVLRVLQAEGYVPDRGRRATDGAWQATHPAPLAPSSTWIDGRAGR